MKKIILLLMLSTMIFANEQDDCLQNVLKVAKQYTKYQTTIAAKAMQETSCLKKNVIGDDGTSFGALQFKLTTAREVLSTIPKFSYLTKFSNIRLKSLLLADKNLSIILACKRFEQIRKRRGYKIAVQAHNGLKGNFNYYKKIEIWKQWILNKKF